MYDEYDSVRDFFFFLPSSAFFGALALFFDGAFAILMSGCVSEINDQLQSVPGSFLPILAEAVQILSKLARRRPLRINSTGVACQVRRMPIRQPNFGDRAQFFYFVGVL